MDDMVSAEVRGYATVEEDVSERRIRHKRLYYLQDLSETLVIPTVS